MKELEFYFSPFGYCTAVYEDGVSEEWGEDIGTVRSNFVELRDIKIGGESIMADLSVTAITRATSEFHCEYEAHDD